MTIVCSFCRLLQSSQRNRRQWICEILDVNNRTVLAFLWPSISATGQVSSNIFNINATRAFYYLLHLLKVLCLKCDSKLKDHHFNSWILILILILSFGPSTQNLFWYIICNFGFKIQPVDRLFFWQVKRTYLERHVHQKLAFLTQKLAHVWIQSIHK